MTFEEFKTEVNRIAGYLKTRVSRVFNDDGTYVARLKNCDAFDRLKITGGASSGSITFHYGAGHKRVYQVVR